MYAREAWQVYRFALRVGFSSLWAGSLSIGMKQLALPVGYWRFPVFGTAVRALGKLPAGSSVLDIGSPKLLSLYCSLVKGHRVWATDLQDDAIHQRYARHFAEYRFRRSPEGEYLPEFQDGARLGYENDAFDAVYSLSVIEHIPGRGDSACCAEVCRVLRPGGLAVIEVPFADKERDTYVARSVYGREYESEPLFYQRHYDPTTLHERLVSPSGMRLVEGWVLSERLGIGDRWQQLPLPVRAPSLWAEALVSRLNLVSCPLSEWRGGWGGGAMSVTVVLEKA